MATSECSRCAAVARLRLTSDQRTRLLVAPPVDLPVWFG
jgi:hypothetical protein